MLSASFAVAGFQLHSLLPPPPCSSFCLSGALRDPASGVLRPNATVYNSYVIRPVRSHKHTGEITVGQSKVNALPISA